MQTVCGGGGAVLTCFVVEIEGDPWIERGGEAARHGVAAGRKAGRVRVRVGRGEGEEDYSPCCWRAMWRRADSAAAGCGRITF